MSNVPLKRKKHTKVYTDEDGIINVVYHNTVVISIDQKKLKITLNNGGWKTNTTKNRINQAAREYNLGFKIHQINYAWYVWTENSLSDFRNLMTIDYPENNSR